MVCSPSLLTLSCVLLLLAEDDLSFLNEGSGRLCPTSAFLKRLANVPLGASLLASSQVDEIFYYDPNSALLPQAIIPKQLLS